MTAERLADAHASAGDLAGELAMNAEPEARDCIDLRDPRLGPLGKDYMATVRYAMRNIHGVYAPLPDEWPEKKKI